MSSTTAPAVVSIATGSTGYVNALQVCAAVLTVVLFGWFWAFVKIAPASSVPAMNAYMFYVGIPCLVFQGLAVQVFSTLNWTFVLLFLALRAVLFVLWVAIDLIIARRKLGTIVSDYMNSTWINTVIFGIPIMQALFGAGAAIYAVLASISSFFFQLPLQIILFEINLAFFKDSSSSHSTATDTKKVPDAKLEVDWDGGAVPVMFRDRVRVLAFRIGKALVFSVLLNPVIIAIVAGIIFSVTGWKLPTYLSTFLTWCGDSVTPLAAFSIGVFMYRPIPHVWKFWALAGILMLVKVFVMPALCIGLVVAFGLRGPAAQMAVLMSALPIAISCYVFSLRYKEEEELSAWMVVISTVFMLPVQIMWIAILLSSNFQQNAAAIITNSTNTTNVNATIIANVTSIILNKTV